MTKRPDHATLGPDDWEACLRVLRAVVNDPVGADPSEEFKTLVAKINRTARKQRRRAQQADRTEDALVLPRMPRARACYVCKASYQSRHPRYALLCPACGALNEAKRAQQANLTGRVALVTGGRVKIGHEVALRLLRCGARVIVTTRFPHDASRRFEQQPDFNAWRHRLEVHGLDLRHLGHVQDFIQGLVAREASLDILINNAAQTIARPAAYYARLLEAERHAAPAVPGVVRSGFDLVDAGTPLALPDAPTIFPPGVLDADGQQLDLRAENSWSQRLHEVPPRDFLEAYLVNATAPFLLCAGVKPLMLRSVFERRFIVNVSAMEGQFNRAAKTVFHPHTNMAKAALNMLTRTSAADYASVGIFMNSVDTGWITNEHPHATAERMRAEGFVLPLDVIDGAARILDPVLRGVNEPDPPLRGHFLKDYAPYPW